MRVAVIGAGVVGVATAYYLARDGHAVTVIDRGAAPAQGCSHANAGLVSGHTASPWTAPGIPSTVLTTFWRSDAAYKVRPRLDPAMAVWAARFFANCSRRRVAAIKAPLRRLAAHSVELLHEVRTRESLDYDAGGAGIMYLHDTPKALDRATAAAQGDPDPRTHPRRLSWDDACALEPCLAQSQTSFAGALHYHQDETGDARLFTEALARAATEAGATIRLDTTVRAIAIDGARVRGVTTDAGDIEVDAVVLAAGTGSAALAAPFGIRLPIYPVKGYSVTVTARDPGALPTHALQNAGRKITTTTMGNRLRIAGTAELAGHDARLDRRRADALLAAAQQLLPELAWDELPAYWAGLRPLTPDCLPILGATEIDGLWLNTGHGSHGWTLACGSGRVVADLVGGRKPAVSLDGLGLR